MKVGNIVKWHADRSAPLVTGIVIDTWTDHDTPYALVFWFDLGVSNHHRYMDLAIISRAA
jgi:hypothetical protein